MNDVSRPAAPEVIHAPPAPTQQQLAQSVQQQQLHRPVCLRPTPVRPRAIACATPSAVSSAQWVAPEAALTLDSTYVADYDQLQQQPPPPPPPRYQQEQWIEETPAEALYRQAHETGVDLAEVHLAVKESHEWHWKWSDCRQETPAHGYNNNHNDTTNLTTDERVEEEEETAAMMQVSDARWLSSWAESPPDDSLRGGAKNPSPVFLSEDEEECEEEEEGVGEEDVRKRVRDGGDPYRMPQPQQQRQYQDQAHGSFVPEDHVVMSPLSQDEDDEDNNDNDDAHYRWIKRRMHHHAAPAPPTAPAVAVVVRPIPLRIARPAAPQPQFTKDFFTHTVPSDILQDYHRPSYCYRSTKDDSESKDASVPRSLSPLTAPSHSTTTVRPMQQGARNMPELDQEKKGAKVKDYDDDDDDDDMPAPTRAPALVEPTFVHVIEPEDDEELVHQQEEQQQQQQQPPLVVYRPLASRVSLGSCASSVSSCSQDSVIDAASSELAWRQARDGILHALAANGGDPTGALFDESLAVLEQQFAASTMTNHTDTRSAAADAALSGMWLTLTKPMFFGCLGTNEEDDPMYTLGRMTFDMFAPTNLICSLQGNFNSIERVCSVEERQALLQSAHVPKAFREEVEAGESVLRTYK